MRVSDWSSDVCSSDLASPVTARCCARSSSSNAPSPATQRRSCTPTWASTRGSPRSPATRDRKSTRLTPVTNAHPVCRLLLEKKNIHTPNQINDELHTTANEHIELQSYIPPSYSRISQL